MAKKKTENANPCPCQSGQEFNQCCEVFLKGTQKPETAEKLLRSRYTAFVLGNVDYIMTTHHTKTIGEIDRNGIEEWSRSATWHGLEIKSIEQGTAKDDEGTIEFVARYTQEGRTYNHHEFSLFKKDNGEWKFYDIKKNQPVKTENRIGRNDPCICGSGKKYKKCHGEAQSQKVA